jgi:protein ImuB
VEFADAGTTAVIPIAPLTRLMGGPGQIASEIARRLSEHGLHGNIGIAAQPDTAVLAARSIPGVTIIPQGFERNMLGKLQVGVLPVSNEALRVLDHWGIHTLDEFCSLPEAGILERLGKDGLQLLRIAKGHLVRPLRPEPQGVNYTERIETENPLTLLEPLLFLLSRMLHELCERLRSQSRATTQIRLRLELEGQNTHTRILQLPFPTHDQKTLLKLLQLDLEAHPPQAAIRAATLAVEPVEPRVVQHDLYTPPSPEPERLELTLGKIRAMVGIENAGSPELLDTHRRDAWKMNATPNLVAESFEAPRENGLRLAFRYFRPPLRARVELVGATGRPAKVFAQQIYGAVVECAGPWKASGEWFTSAPWDREEWDLGLNDGGIYRAYSAASPRREQDREWFLEGSYD